MYFLVNASPPKLLEAARKVHRSHDVEGTEQHFVWSMSNKILSCNLKLCRCICQTIWRVSGNILCVLSCKMRLLLKIPRSRSKVK